jgi:hypothetical protein
MENGRTTDAIILAMSGESNEFFPPKTNVL